MVRAPRSPSRRLPASALCSAAQRAGPDMPAASALRRSSERRAERLLSDLLESQGWDTRRPPLGDVLVQHEYRAYPELAQALAGASKGGLAFGVPEAIILDRKTGLPLAVIEAKSGEDEIGK